MSDLIRYSNESYYNRPGQGRTVRVQYGKLADIPGVGALYEIKVKTSGGKNYTKNTTQNLAADSDTDTILEVPQSAVTRVKLFEYFARHASRSWSSGSSSYRLRCRLVLGGQEVFLKEAPIEESDANCENPQENILQGSGPTSYFEADIIDGGSGFTLERVDGPTVITTCVEGPYSARFRIRILNVASSTITVHQNAFEGIESVTLIEDYPLPASPVNVETLEVGDGFIRFGADPSPSENITGYNAYYDDGTGSVKDNGALLSAAEIADYRAEPLDSETTYELWFTAVDQWGNESEASTKVQETTPEPQAESFETDFSEYTTGQMPTGWKVVGTPFDDRFQVTVEEGGIFTGGKYMKIAGNVGNDPLGIVVDGTAVADVDILIRARFPDLNGTLGPAARITGTSKINGYAHYASMNETAGELNNQILFELTNDSWNTLTNTAYNGTQIVPGDFFWMRFQSIGTTHRGRIWADGESEPGSWQFSVSDGVHDIGLFGIFNRTSNTIQIDTFEANEILS